MYFHNKLLLVLFFFCFFLFCIPIQTVFSHHLVLITHDAVTTVKGLQGSVMTNRSGLVCVEENNRLQQRFGSSLLRRLQYSGKFQCLVIFIGMFAPKWARGPHKLARFPSWDSCITPGYWAQYFNALPSSEHCLIHSCPERSYTFVFCPPPPPLLPSRTKPAYAALLRIRIS